MENKEQIFIELRNKHLDFDIINLLHGKSALKNEEELKNVNYWNYYWVRMNFDKKQIDNNFYDSTKPSITNWDVVFYIPKTFDNVEQIINKFYEFFDDINKISSTPIDNFTFLKQRFYNRYDIYNKFMIENSDFFPTHNPIFNEYSSFLPSREQLNMVFHYVFNNPYADILFNYYLEKRALLPALSINLDNKPQILQGLKKIWSDCCSLKLLNTNQFNEWSSKQLLSNQVIQLLWQDENFIKFLKQNYVNESINNNSNGLDINNLQYLENKYENAIPWNKSIYYERFNIDFKDSYYPYDKLSLDIKLDKNEVFVKQYHLSILDFKKSLYYWVNVSFIRNTKKATGRDYFWETDKNKTYSLIELLKLGLQFNHIKDNEDFMLLYDSTTNKISLLNKDELSIILNMAKTNLYIQAGIMKMRDNFQKCIDFLQKYEGLDINLTVPLEFTHSPMEIIPPLYKVDNGNSDDSSGGRSQTIEKKEEQKPLQKETSAPVIMNEPVKEEQPKTQEPKKRILN